MDKWIEFIDVGLSKSGVTKIWDVRPITRQDDNLSGVGHVSWYGPWRKYAFFPKTNTVFEEDCLRLIADFCARETKTHKALKKGT